MTQLKLYLLGAPRVEVNTVPVDLPRRKVLALLIYTALANQPQQRDALATLLWPESERKAARAALRRELHTLNGAIGEGWLVTTRDSVAIDPDALIWSDVALFRNAVSYADRNNQSGSQTNDDYKRKQLEEAIALYQGDFLAGFTLSDCPAFDDWQFFEAEGLRRDYANALMHLAHHNRGKSAYEVAIDYTRRRLALDPLDESVHCELMELYALAGQQAAAVRQYDECVRILDEELGVPPDPETESLYEAIRTRKFSRQDQKAGTTGEAPVPVTQASVQIFGTPPQLPHNLPAQATSFVGREDELTAICKILCEEQDCRLLTLVGPGGIGKTRLALQVAKRLVNMAEAMSAISAVTERYADGIYFVPLETAEDSEQIIITVADAIGFTFQGNARPRDQLLNYLRAKQMLLLLDNLEHLLDEAELLVIILQHAPTITLLTTSREALALQEEWLYVVTGFALPDQRDEFGRTGKIVTETEPADITDNYAVQLFLQRARRTDSSLTISPEAIAQIVRICYFVDGLPLGLELAATWVRALSLTEIGDEIASDLDFLVATHHGIPKRHSSLRAVLEQTWRLLTPTEQDAFCRLSIFHNGFTRQAANRVAEASMILLAALVRKSIINHNRDQRYTMHGLLRQFAASRLRENPTMAEMVSEKHSRFYAFFLQALESELLGNTHAAALTQIGQELENIRRGWRWLFNGDRQTIDLKLANHYVDTLFHFYDTRSRFQEGWVEFQLAAERLDSGATAPDTQLLLGRVCGRLGWFAFQTGRPAEAQSYLQQSIGLLHGLNAKDKLIFSLNYLGAIQRHLGQYDAAIETLNESRRLCQECSDHFGSTIALNILGQIAYEQQSYAQAERYLQESITLKQTIGDRRGTTFSLLYLGLVATAQADYAPALRFLHESKLISEEYGDRRGLALALSSMADVETAIGHIHQADTLYDQSLAIFTEIYNLPGIVTSYVKLGDLARHQNDMGTARQHYTTALSMANDLQLPPPTVNALLTEAKSRLAAI